ncbi:diguanylate cyclase (GGDEF)-like protein [Azospirillum lipoferum]|uniref:diguanylate cyclase n=1 Tax=Azospirillum lipoferum TaxID=193 RepID=A0A5A9GJD9_AZOLI|nr:MULTISPECIES: GGDEF domain-containing response regulator [Azospirillum]KAA0594487.1 diguanylate cyclase [Azospirillum lipoferum]MCP1613239.1 diguanylate cyclase (GGDEF)-like protein [Azospirillum lipoferum]MDW5531438.1 diguanylate cyclase [Azospirillum sp. NL1]
MAPDDLMFQDDDAGTAPTRLSSAAIPWPVLVVDDDEQVHAMTRVLLNDFEFEGRRFAVVSAFSAAEARVILAERTDLPVVLLDVVMETQDAGLRLVHHIRRDLGNRHIRIILRTGQPGQAPERDAIVAYDINDYKSKAELTAQKLFTSLVSAVRGWCDLVTIETLNQSLERRVAERTAELERQTALADEQRRFIENLVELMPSPVWYRDAAGRYALCNRAFRELFPNAAEGIEWSVGTQDVSEQAPAGTDSFSFETSVSGADGDSRELLVVKRPLSSPDGAAAGVIGIATDITERRRMERELQRLATTDPLSGAHNRRHILDLLERLLTGQEAVADSRQTGGAACLVMLDIDHFKRINDEMGHGAGDIAIRRVVEEIRSQMRATDQIGRIGGEEFAILLPDSSRADGVAIAERLRNGLAALAIELPDGRCFQLTGSFGLTEVRPLGDTVESVLGRADQALYRAKALGRNRVEVT